MSDLILKYKKNSSLRPALEEFFSANSQDYFTLISEKEDLIIADISFKVSLVNKLMDPLIKAAIEKLKKSFKFKIKIFFESLFSEIDKDSLILNVEKGLKSESKKLAREALVLDLMNRFRKYNPSLASEINQYQL